MAKEDDIESIVSDGDETHIDEEYEPNMDIDNGQEQEEEDMVPYVRKGVQRYRKKRGSAWSHRHTKN